MSDMTNNKILIVDDDEIVVKSLITILSGEGYNVEYAYDGKTAVSKALKGKFKLILLDVKLPGLDGFQVLERLKGSASTVYTPVIFISSSDDDSIYEKGFDMGVMDYLKKPVSKAELFFRIKNYLRLREAEEKLLRSETFFKSVVEAQTEFVVRYKPAGEMIFANTAFCRYLNMSEEETESKNFYDLMSLDKKSPLRLNETGTRKPVKTEIICFKSSEGKPVWQQWTWRTVRDETTHKVFIQSVGRDITEILETTNKLKDSEEKFRTIFKNTPDVIAIVRQKDFALADVNDKFLTTYGFSKEDVLDKPGFVEKFFANPEDIKKLLHQIKRTGSITDEETILKTPSGQTYHALVSISKIKLNRLSHAVVIVRNIEDLKRSQESLLKSETKFRLLADYNYNWEFWMGTRNRFIYVSPSCERVTGYKAEEFMENWEIVLNQIHPDFGDTIIPHLKNEYCNKSDATSLKFKMTDRFGNEKWILHNCKPVFDDKGRFMGRRGNNLDITIKKVDEQELLKLSTAVEQISSAIVITDTKGLIQYVNPYFEKLTGYSSAEVTGRNPRMLKSGKTDPKTYVELWNSITSGKIWQGEFVNKKKNGELFIENATISPIKDHNDKIVNFVAIKYDITKQKEIDRQILQTIILTEEKERGRFAQDLHDDLGPLLSTAKLYIRSFESAKDSKHREIAINQSVKAIDEAILSIKEISNNISPHVLRNFGLDSGIHSLVNKINETKTIKISFSSTLKERLDESAESSIFRIISELVNNTLKHAMASRAYIDINKNENDLILTYSDNGIGFKIEAALKKKMCRGLTNILNRVKLLGGDAELDSTTDKGFNIFIRLPFTGLLTPHDH
jgi:PAS domain S-box-containing protein